MKLPQVSLRDLFWLVALAALGLAWWIEKKNGQTLVQRHRNEQAQAKALEQELRISRDTLDQQYRHLYARHTVDHRFHFDIYQYPDGKVDVRYVEDDAQRDATQREAEAAIE